MAFAIDDLPWIQDGIADAIESEALQHLLDVAVFTSTPAAWSIIALDWIQDDISSAEKEALHGIHRMANAETAEAVVALSWLQDGIASLESQMIRSLAAVDHNSVDVVLKVASLSWLQDSVESAEVELVRRIADFTDHTSPRAEAMLQIADMPFLKTVEEFDAVAIWSLDRLSDSRGDAFDYVMAHPALEGGITDDLAVKISTSWPIEQDSTNLIDSLLREETTVERRTVNLPLAGDVDLAIIKTSPGTTASMDDLEYVTRVIEEFMGAPFPVNYVGLLYHAPVRFGGTNYGTHMTIRPITYVSDEDVAKRLAKLTMAHEVAHYYWRGNAQWVDEGAADFTMVIVGSKPGPPALLYNSPCTLMRTIAELEEADVPYYSQCNYSLGERLFFDLYEELREEHFRQGFLALYLNSIDENSRGISHVTQAFGDKASNVIARWYDGSEPYNLTRFDDRPVDPDLSALAGSKR